MLLRLHSALGDEEGSDGQFGRQRQQRGNGLPTRKKNPSHEKLDYGKDVFESAFLQDLLGTPGLLTPSATLCYTSVASHPLAAFEAVRESTLQPPCFLRGETRSMQHYYSSVGRGGIAE